MSGMSSNVAPKSRPPGFDGERFSVEALRAFCTLPPGQVGALKDLALHEDWGPEDVALLCHLALHVPLAVEQGRFALDGKQMVLRAGHLATPAGAPLYLGLARPHGNLWALEWSRTQPSKIVALTPASLGAWPALDAALDVVVAMDHVRELEGLPLPMAQAAIAGAVRWSMHRELAVRTLRGDNRGYALPVHLRDRDGGPDLVAATEVQDERLLVRALMRPRAAYPAARAVVQRRDELPLWLRDAWDTPVNNITESSTD